MLFRSKIPAIPKAPKVTIDYVKGLVKLGKNTEYTTLAKAVAATPVWTKTSDSAAKGVEIGKLLQELGGSEGTSRGGASSTTEPIKLVVRTIGGEKKADSAWTFVALNELKDLVKTDATEGGNGGTVTLTGTDKKLTWENTSKGIKLKAEGGAFDYYDAAKKTWKAVAAGKTVEVKLKNGADLEVRASGTKATKDKDGSFFTNPETLTCDLLAAKVTVTAKETVKKGEAVTLTVEAVDGNGDKLEIGEDGKTVEWKVSGCGVAEVTNNKVIPTAVGEMTITATVDGVTGTVKITVEEAD